MTTVRWKGSPPPLGFGRPLAGRRGTPSVGRSGRLPRRERARRDPEAPTRPRGVARGTRSGHRPERRNALPDRTREDPPFVRFVQKILKYLEEQEGLATLRLTVKDIMNRAVVTVDSSATLHVAAQRMESGAFSQLPVVGEGRVVGSLSEGALLRALGHPRAQRIRVEGRPRTGLPDRRGDSRPRSSELVRSLPRRARHATRGPEGDRHQGGPHPRVARHDPATHGAGLGFPIGDPGRAQDRLHGASHRQGSEPMGRRAHALF